MYKRINTRAYNTDTAKELAHVERGEGYGWYEETLYRKRNGEYFIYGYGYAASKYAAPCPGGGSQAGEDIVPLDYDQALDWAEQHLDGGEVDGIFGPSDENDKSQERTVTLSTVAFDRLNYIIKIHGGTRIDHIEWLIRNEYEDVKAWEDYRSQY
ncbi:hypothetical protein [Bifidobacterium aerophilum]|uniref:Uncharacterized protein n=1 Tax=Bifidobacterium aerophilum TaxID=1798155 RepID=A0A6N9Z8R9_9BIFI|nr:hypothetical protein [Bifidobacterium aerophilum]NEG90493.1 hypothetical protein [Bifidobacterium aerophilum]